ncbi:MAG: M56 family metallopeptidase, partial [Anaerotignum sp.]
VYDVIIYGKLRREIQKGREASPSLKGKISAAGERYDLPKQERVKVCGGFETPFLCGFFKPILVIPESMEESMDEKVLLHEMLHLKHHDVLVNFALHLLQALNWFNPFVYWLCRVIRNDSEALCDQRALERLEGEEKREYGMLLLGMADRRHASRIGTTSMANGAKNIKTRVQRIADFGRAPKGAAFATGCITVVLCLASVSYAYAPKYFDTSEVETKEDLELLLEDARYFDVTSPEMAISIFYEAIYEKDLGKLALTVPRAEFDSYKEWALQEYAENRKAFGAQLAEGTKADYKYKFYGDMRYDGVYFFEREESGAIKGMLHIIDETDARYNDVPVTERFLYFRVLEEEKGNWSIEVCKEDSRLFDVYNPSFAERKLKEKMENGEYTQYGDWKMAEASYCFEWGMQMSGGNLFSFMNFNNEEPQFNETISPDATYAIYLEYTGTEWKEKEEILVLYLCPGEMTDAYLWDRETRGMRGYSPNGGGSSSDGSSWCGFRTGKDWDGSLMESGDIWGENLNKTFDLLENPYEMRIYTLQGERLVTIPLQGGVLYEE